LFLYAGSNALGGLRDATKEWIASKRSELQQVMWSNVGIQRRTKDMAAALESLHTMSLEAQVPFAPLRIIVGKLAKCWAQRLHAEGGVEAVEYNGIIISESLPLSF